MLARKNMHDQPNSRLSFTNRSLNARDPIIARKMIGQLYVKSQTSISSLLHAKLLPSIKSLLLASFQVPGRLSLSIINLFSFFPFFSGLFPSPFLIPGSWVLIMAAKTFVDFSTPAIRFSATDVADEDGCTGELEQRSIGS